MSRSILVLGDIPDYLDDNGVVKTLKGYFKKDELFQNNSVESISVTDYHGEGNDQDGTTRAYIAKFSYPIGEEFERSERKINFGGFTRLVTLRLCPDDGQQGEAIEKGELDEQNESEDDGSKSKQSGELGSTGGVKQIIPDSGEGEEEFNKGKKREAGRTN
ncbi:uncharacterized protein [Ptychodera flava]|uniref:uncharacterized protein n=1 Tax=Ptychodera flava TaxID=63121 RepID=UPI00396A6CD3